MANEYAPPLFEWPEDLPAEILEEDAEFGAEALVPLEEPCS